MYENICGMEQTFEFNRQRHRLGRIQSKIPGAARNNKIELGGY